MALDLYSSCRLSGVAAPGLEMGSSNPPSFSTAATSSAQTSERWGRAISQQSVTQLRVCVCCMDSETNSDDDEETALFRKGIRWEL